MQLPVPTNHKCQSEIINVEFRGKPDNIKDWKYFLFAQWFLNSCRKWSSFAFYWFFLGWQQATVDKVSICETTKSITNSEVNRSEKMVCYVIWIDPSFIDPTICTHIVYGLLGFNSTGTLTYSISRAQVEGNFIYSDKILNNRSCAAF